MKSYIILFIIIVISIYYYTKKDVEETDENEKDNEYPYEIVSHNPDIRLYKNFISEDEAKYLISISKDQLEKSTVLEDGKHIQHKERTSSSTVLNHNDDIIKKINKKVCKILGCKKSNIEDLQIVNYKKSQKYSPHYDFFDDDEIIRQGGQRKHTFLCYLNSLDETDGGTTSFPKLNIKIKPTLGTALYFSNLDKNGNEDLLTLHGGDPIANDSEKWACNIWVRDRHYRPIWTWFKNLWR